MMRPATNGIVGHWATMHRLKEARGLRFHSSATVRTPTGFRASNPAGSIDSRAASITVEQLQLKVDYTTFAFSWETKTIQ